MIRTTLFLILCLFSYNLFSQSNENLYAKDGVLIGKKKDLIVQCANVVEVKARATFDDKYEVCECVLNLICKFYTSKELIALMNSGTNPYKAIFTSENPLVKTEFKECSGKYLEILDPSKNMVTMAPNFSENHIIACEYQLNNDEKIDKKKIDVNKFCDCLDKEYSKRGITISTLKEFQDENSVSYNEILQKCANVSVINNIGDDLNTNDVESEKSVDLVPIIDNGSSYKVKISIGNISKYFVIDSGASDITISTSLERELLLDSLIKKENYINDGIYTLADGKEIRCRKLILNNIEIGSFKVNNVVIAIVESGNDLLLGKSFLNKFYKWSIDNQSSQLKLEKRYSISQNSNDYYQNGVLKYDSKDYLEAIKYFNKAVNYTLNQKESFYYRAKAKYGLKDYIGTIADCANAIKIDSKFSEAYNIKGIAEDDLKDYKKAIFDYTKAIEINPNYNDAYYNRAISKYNIQDYKGSIADYTKALKIKPNQGGIYFNRAISKRNLGDYEGAILDYTKAIKIKPIFNIAYFNRGNTKLFLKNYKGAIEDFTKAIDIDHSDSKAYYSRGSSKFLIGQKDSACLDWSKALELGELEADDLIKKYCN